MLKNIVEALIFATAKGVDYQTIKSAFSDKYTEKEIKAALFELKNEYSGDRGIVLIKINDCYQFQTNPEYGEKLSDILMPIKIKQLSNTVLQTLAIIAYRQPITRAEIEDIRGGVNSDYAVGVLVKAELVEIVGRKKTVGHPALFGTNDNFLRRFQLESLSDLPDYDKMLEYAKQSGKYAKPTENLFGIEEENAETTSDSPEYFADVEDDAPEFLEGEDIVVIE